MYHIHDMHLICSTNLDFEETTSAFERCASSTGTLSSHGTASDRQERSLFVLRSVLRNRMQLTTLPEATILTLATSCNVEPAIGVESEPFFLVVSKDNFVQVQRLNSHYGNNISARC